MDGNKQKRATGKFIHPGIVTGVFVNTKKGVSKATLGLRRGIVDTIATNKKTATITGILLLAAVLVFAGFFIVPILTQNSRYNAALKQARTAQAAKDTDRAIEQSVKAIDLARNTDQRLDAYAVASESYIQANNAKDMLEQAEKIHGLTAKEDPNYPRVLAILATAQYQKLELNSAVKSMEELINLHKKQEQGRNFVYSQLEAQQLLDKYRYLYLQQGDGEFKPASLSKPPQGRAD